MNDLYEIKRTNGQHNIHRHFHDGQKKAYNSNKRFIAIFAGTQGGKTSFGPHWLLREIQRCGPGDYLIATPTFPLLQLKLLPEFKRLFETHLQLGKYTASPTKIFKFSSYGLQRMFGSKADETNIFFGHAQDPDSLESATAKGAWLDEAGQKKFKLESWQAIQRRLSIHQGRALLTTTIYNLGWLKSQFYDRWKMGNPDYDVISFKSIDNPAFPKEEYDRARDELPGWKFNMFYNAIFTRPAGLIYDCIDEQKHKVPRFEIPPEWPRYLGLDFGGVNTVGVFYAAERKRENAFWGEETGRLFAYREYRAGNRTAAEHTKFLLADREPGIPYCVGGSKSEGQWRDEFRAAGLPIQEPDITEVELGIERVYGANKKNEILYFDDLQGFWDQKQTYSRELDDLGQPTEKIEDKETFHFMDAERYIISWLKRNIGHGIYV